MSAWERRQIEREAYRAAWAEARAACSWTARDLLPGERAGARARGVAVPPQLSIVDAAVAAWVATGDSLRDAELAFAVIRRAPLVEAFPARGEAFDAVTARETVRELRAGRAVDTSSVVRLACHMLEER